MKELLSDVEKLADNELLRANAKFPQFNSAHEGYAVILEEVDEHEDDAREIQRWIAVMWPWIKKNDLQQVKPCVENLRKCALHAAAEAIQIAAMAQKFMDREDNCEKA